MAFAKRKRGEQWRSILFVAGRYSITYNSVDIGIMEEGIELQQDSKAELIDKSDAYGDSVIDAIYRGGDVFFQMESKAYKAGSYTPFWPWGNLGVMLTAAAPLGRLFSDTAQALVLTDTDATPAATFPATLTASKALLAPNVSGRLMFNSRLRKVPIRLQAFPTNSAGTVTWFTQT